MLIFLIITLGTMLDVCHAVVCEDPVDMVFVVDGSGSICDHDDPKYSDGSGCPNWVSIRDFMVNVVQEYIHVGPNDSHVGLVTFANRGIVRWQLNAHPTKIDLQNAMRALPYPGGNTNTYEGVNKMRTQILGTPNDRPNIKNLAFLITDGFPTINVHMTDPEIQRVKDDGICMFVIGVSGNSVTGARLPKNETLKRWSCNNTYYFVVQAFVDLHEAVDALMREACQRGPASSTTSSTSSTTAVSTRAPSTPAPPVSTTSIPTGTAPRCSQRSDLVFIMDSSGSIGDLHYGIMLKAINAMMTKLDVTSGFNRVALIAFSNSAIVEFFLNCVVNSGISNCNTNPTYLRGTTNLAAALDLAVSSVFQPQNGDRSGVPNIAIVFTDGGSNNESATIASALKAKRIMTIMTVGIGKWTDEYELRSVASYPSSTYYRPTQAFDDLISDNFLGKLTDFVCNNINECTTNPCRNGGTCVNGLNRYNCRCPRNYGGVNCQYSCVAPADVVFVLDASGSVGKSNFMKMVDFAGAVTKQLPTGQGTRVGLVTFANDVKGEFKLNSYNSLGGTLDGMSGIHYRMGTTNTAAAIRYLRTDMFTANAGDQPNAPNVAIVVTDGLSNNMSQTWAEAIKTRAQGIQLLSVGIGDGAQDSELRAIANYPAHNNLFHVTDYDALTGIISNIKSATCNDINECSSNPCQNGGTCRDVMTGFYCLCRQQFTGRLCERGCPGQIDLLYMLDKSGSIRSEWFQDVLEMIGDTVNELEVWEDKVRIAAISFSDTSRIDFFLNTYKTKQDIREAIARIHHDAGRTNIAAALELADDNIYAPVNGDRPGVQDVIIMFTDGASNIRQEETVARAIEHKVDGVHVIMVAVGKHLNMANLQGMATSPAGAHILSVDSFSKLKSLVPAIISATCNDNDECASNPCQNGGSCRNWFSRYECSCVSGWTGMNCQRTCRRQYDLLFLVDLSGSLTSVYNQTVAFIKCVIYGLDMNNDRTRLALATFADSAQVVFKLNELQDKRDVLHYIVFTNIGGRTNTHAALNLARNQIFQARNGDRPRVTNKIVLLTDSGSNINPHLTVPEANAHANQGIHIHVIAIGDQVDMMEANQVGRDVRRVRNEGEAAQMCNSFLNSICQ